MVILLSMWVFDKLPSLLNHTSLGGIVKSACEKAGKKGCPYAGSQ